MILRIGALEYDPSPEIVKHTLDARMEQGGNSEEPIMRKIHMAQDLLKFNGFLTKDHV